MCIPRENLSGLGSRHLLAHPQAAHYTEVAGSAWPSELSKQLSLVAAACQQLPAPPVMAAKRPAQVRPPPPQARPPPRPSAASSFAQLRSFRGPSANPAPGMTTGPVDALRPPSAGSAQPGIVLPQGKVDSKRRVRMHVNPLQVRSLLTRARWPQPIRFRAGILSTRSRSTRLEHGVWQRRQSCTF